MSCSVGIFLCLPASTKSLPKYVSSSLLIFFASCKGTPRRQCCILDSTPWIPFFRYRIPDFLSVELGFRIPIFSWWDFRFLELYSGFLILLHEKFLQFDWLGAVVFQPNLKYLVVQTNNSMICTWYLAYHLWYFKINSNFNRLTAREIT